jgi:hypothetical protein
MSCKVPRVPYLALLTKRKERLMWGLCPSVRPRPIISDKKSLSDFYENSVCEIQRNLSNKRESRENQPSEIMLN